MTSDKSIEWLGKPKEKRALKLCQGHMDEIVKVTEAMRDSVQSFSKNKEKFQEKSEKVQERERSADEKKSQILKELSRGNFPPLSREMIIRLILTTDDIGDNARAATLKLGYLEPKKISDEVLEGLNELSKIACESSASLKETFSLLLENPEKAIEKTEEVEKIEEKADNFRANTLIPKIIEWADKSKNPGTSYILSEVEDNIEDVVDRTENSADVIREIAIRVV